MKFFLKYPVCLVALILLGSVAPTRFAAAAQEEPDWARSKAQSRGTSSSHAQYLLESPIVGGKAQFIRLVVFEDRPEFADYNKAHFQDMEGSELKTVALGRQQAVAVEGVREIVGVYLPESALRNIDRRLTVVIDGPGDTLKVNLSASYVKSFLKSLDSKTR